MNANMPGYCLSLLRPDFGSDFGPGLELDLLLTPARCNRRAIEIGAEIQQDKHHEYQNIP